jgi:DNA replication and repair protein RecF
VDQTLEHQFSDSPSAIGGLRIARVRVRNFRNYEQADLSLQEGTTVFQGPTGAGKTNLLEAIHFALTGKSCRSANDRDLIRFGERATRAVVTTAGPDLERTFETGLEVGKPKLLKADGAAVDQAPAGEGRPYLCVFMPDRLELVKGPARVRRERFDGFVVTLWPARRGTRLSYVRALAQRNALLGRIRAGSSSATLLVGWNHELARYGVELMKHRADVVDLLAPRFATRALELGLGSATLGYRPRSKATRVDELEAELADSSNADLDRGYTLHGPHRDDFRFELDGRDMRRFGSQGQQRIALLALLLAERDVFKAARGESPILLLDDVLSELDMERRSRLMDALGVEGQALITTAEPESAWAAGAALPAVRVEAGRIDG